MAVFYTGYRNVTKGRSWNVVHPYKGTVATYSNYQLWNESNVLDGAPNTDHVPGTGLKPGNAGLSRQYLGLWESHPMDNPGTSTLVAFDPLTYKGLPGAGPLRGSFGYTYVWSNADRKNWAGHSDLLFSGLDSAQTISGTFGHAAGTLVYSSVDTLGNDLEFDGVGTPTGFDATYGITDQASFYNDANNPDTYGRTKTNEWKGVPSAQIL